MTCTFLAHGLRHVSDRPLGVDGGPLIVSGSDLEGALDALRPGDELAVLPEPGNTFNPNALLVTRAGTPVGWVPNLLVDDLAQLPKAASLRAFVERVNGPEAPGHLRLVGRLQADDVGSFEFFTSDLWMPIT
jgi:hypothetical protein